MLADRQTDRQTDVDITILRLRYTEGELKTVTRIVVCGHCVSEGAYVDVGDSACSAGVAFPT